MKEPRTTSAEWRKASHSGNGGDCVEVADLATSIDIRDSKNPEGPHLRLSPAEWANLTQHIKSGNLDL
jgi:hypothetical protein